jgi:tRNA-specific 2-thiouridylase
VSSKEPLYVVEIDPVNNAVIVGNSSELQTGEIVIGNLNQLEPFPLAAACRIRSSSPFYKCTISDYSESKLLLKFDAPIGGASPGQSAVLYDGDMVLGGGVIERK